MLSETFEKKLYSNHFPYTDEATDNGHVYYKCKDEQNFLLLFRER